MNGSLQHLAAAGRVWAAWPAQGEPRRTQLHGILRITTVTSNGATDRAPWLLEIEAPADQYPGRTTRALLSLNCGAKLDPVPRCLYTVADEIAIRLSEGRDMARVPILAAGGIVTQRGRTPLIAVVQQRKRNDWVLPKGKLDDGETPRAAAEREVLEETGHQVSVHEFLGTLAYENGGRAKVVHYWRMEADRDQTRELMNDIKAVAWLPLNEALERLTRFPERAFLAQVGPLALEAAATRTAPRRPPTKRAAAAPPRPASPPASHVADQAPSVVSTVDIPAPAPQPADGDNAMEETLNLAEQVGAAEAVNMEEAEDTAAAEDIASAETEHTAGAENASSQTDGIAETENIEEADAPALAPSVREFPVAPQSAEQRKTLLEKALFWLRGRP